MSAKDTSEIINIWFDTAKSVVLLAAVGLVIFGHEQVQNLLNRYNVTKLEIGGVTIDRQKVVDFYNASNEALPKAQADLKVASENIERLTTDYKEALSALGEARDALALVNSRGSPALGGIDVRRQLAAANTALQKGQPVLGAAGQAAASAAQASNEASQVIASLPTLDGAQGFGVVFGGDRNLSEARDQVAAAQSVTSSARIYRREGMYRSVAVYSDKAQADAALRAIRGVNRYSRDAYVVKLASWCPAPTSRDDYTECGLR